MSCCKYFRIKPNDADKIIYAVVKTVSHWRHEATLLGLSASEQNLMAHAFRVVDN